VRLSYRGAVLFEDLDVDLPAGLTTCLLGPSGVGKTSLLRLVAGLTEAGPAPANGMVVDQQGRHVHDRVAYMAQQDLLLPWASVLANVLLGPRLRGEHRDPGVEARARDLIGRVGLAGRGREQDFPAVLSGGMRQRVALARTLMEDRPIVLMDEPFSGLDAITRFVLQELAAHLLDGRTVLLVTEALRLGHRVYVMAGRPARLESALGEAPGADGLAPPPRDPADTDVLARQADLLKRLAKARQEGLEGP
jgi:putative hydroxymethylpyrimidine transport system ATP-binding protein